MRSSCPNQTSTYTIYEWHKVLKQELFNQPVCFVSGICINQSTLNMRKKSVASPLYLEPRLQFLLIFSGINLGHKPHSWWNTAAMFLWNLGVIEASYWLCCIFGSWIEVYGLTNTPSENTLLLCHILSPSRSPSSPGTCSEDLLVSWNCESTIIVESGEWVKTSQFPLQANRSCSMFPSCMEPWEKKTSIITVLDKITPWS